MRNVEELDLSEDSVLGRLARSLGHDFNNYLTGIMGFLSVAEQELPRLSPERHHLERASLYAQRASYLARQLAVLPAGRGLDRRLETLNVRQHIQQSRRLLDLVLPARGLRLLEFESGLPPARGCGLDFRGALLSVVTNAGGDDAAVEHGVDPRRHGDLFFLFIRVLR